MEKPKHKLKIVFGVERAEIEKHARSLLRAQEEYESKNPFRATPRGIAFYASHFPISCDDCGKTFWGRNEWAAHPGCKGTPEKKMGFEYND